MDIEEQVAEAIESVREQALETVRQAAAKARDEIAKAIPATRGSIVRVGLEQTDAGAMVAADADAIGQAMLNQRVSSWLSDVEFGEPA